MKKLKYIYYRFLWHIAPFFPSGLFIHFDLEINNNCNQQCIFCWHSGRVNFELSEKPHRTAFFNIMKARESGALSIKFNLRGEPLLNKNLINYIKYAKKIGYIDIMINTNGVLLDLETFLELQDAGLTTCIISVDSFDKYIYCKLHGATEQQFDKLQSNLFKLRVYKQSQPNSSCKVIFNVHQNELNKNENLIGMTELLYPIKLNIKPTMDRKGTHISNKLKKTKRKKHCPHMKRRLTMLTNGKVYPCCVCYDEPEDIELFELSLDSCWQSPTRLILIDNYKKGIYTFSCKNCTSNDIWR